MKKVFLLIMSFVLLSCVQMKAMDTREYKRAMKIAKDLDATHKKKLVALEKARKRIIESAVKLIEESIDSKTLGKWRDIQQSLRNIRKEEKQLPINEELMADYAIGTLTKNPAESSLNYPLSAAGLAQIHWYGNEDYWPALNEYAEKN